MKRAGTLIRSPLESRQKERDKQGDSDIRASEVCLRSDHDTVSIEAFPVVRPVSRANRKPRLQRG